MSEVDRMDLIEHWVCENCDSVDPPTFKGDERACGICADEGENGLLIRLVPASQLRGAVEALQKIKDEEGKVCDTFEICQHRACNSSYTAWAIADQALARLGGQ